MQRYQLTEYEEAPARARAVYDDVTAVTGEPTPPAWIRSLGNRPALAEAYWGSIKNTLFAGSLPRPLKEMIFFIVAATRDSPYCAARHAARLLACDNTVQPAALRVFLEHGSHIGLPLFYQGVVEFTGKMTTDPDGLTDQDVQALIDAGFSVSDVQEMVSLIAAATMMTSYAGALQLDLEPEYRDLF